MDKIALDSYGVSPAIVGLSLVMSVLIGACLLMATVRWTEGFSISFWRSLIVTTVTVLAAMAIQWLVFAVLSWLGYTSMSAYWLGLGSATLAASFVCIAIYAYCVRRPDGRRIGIGRAIKVSLIQLAVSVALAFAMALVIAMLIINGVVDLPALPPDLQIQLR